MLYRQISCSWKPDVRAAKRAIAESEDDHYLEQAAATGDESAKRMLDRRLEWRWQRALPEAGGAIDLGLTHGLKAQVGQVWTGALLSTLHVLFGLKHLMSRGRWPHNPWTEELIR